MVKSLRTHLRRRHAAKKRGRVFTEQMQEMSTGCACRCTHTHTRARAHTHEQECVTHTQMYTHRSVKHAHARTRTHTHTRAHTHTHTDRSVSHTHIHKRILRSVKHAHVHTRTHAHTHTHTHTHTHVLGRGKTCKSLTWSICTGCQRCGACSPPKRPRGSQTRWDSSRYCRPAERAKTRRHRLRSKPAAHTHTQDGKEGNHVVSISLYKMRKLFAVIVYAPSQLHTHTHIHTHKQERRAYMS